MSSASAAAKTPAVLRRYGTGVIPTPGSKSVPRIRERLLDEDGVPTQRVRQTVSKSSVQYRVLYQFPSRSHRARKKLSISRGEGVFLAEILCRISTHNCERV